MGPNECEECCTTICCSTVGLFCCCRPMKKTTRIKITWAWLIVLAGTSALVLGCAIYAKFQTFASPSDIKPVKDHVNFLFCEVIHIESPGPQFSGYVITGDLKIDQSQKKHTNKDAALFVEMRSFDYFAFYLLQKSKITIKHCARQFLTFYVIIGRTNFDSWNSNNFCDSCYHSQSYIMPHDACNDDNYDSYTMSIDVEDEYFFVYSNDNYEDVWVDTNIELDRSVYDLQNASTTCVNSVDCDIVLEGPDQTAVIWVMEYYDLGKYSHPEFTVNCVPRIWAYLLIHGFPVLLIGITLSIIIQKTCRNPEDDVYTGSTERQRLLYRAALPPSYSAVIREPPKYEDIMRNTEPPPYQEVLAAVEDGRLEQGYNTNNYANVNSDSIIHSSVYTQDENRDTSAIFRIGSPGSDQNPDCSENVNTTEHNEPAGTGIQCSVNVPSVQ